MKFFKSSLAVLSLVGASSLPAFAAVQGHNVSATVGLDSITGGGVSNSSVGFGGRFGTHLDPHWEAGAGFSYASNSSTVGQVSASTSLGLLLADINYHFANEFNPLYVGLRLGLGFKGNSVSGVGSSTDTSNNSTNFAYGAVGGYDAAVGDNFTIGPKVAYTVLTPANGTSTSDFQAHVAFKYFF